MKSGESTLGLLQRGANLLAVAFLFGGEGCLRIGKGLLRFGALGVKLLVPLLGGLKGFHLCIEVGS